MFFTLKEKILFYIDSDRDELGKTDLKHALIFCAMAEMKGRFQAGNYQEVIKWPYFSASTEACGKVEIGIIPIILTALSQKTNCTIRKKKCREYIQKSVGGKNRNNNYR